MASPSGSVSGIYMPLIRIGKLIGILRHNFQFPCETTWTVGGKNHCGPRVTSIISFPFRFFALGVFFLYFAFLGLVTMYRVFGLTVVNDTLKAVTWSILGITSIAIFAFFRINASQIEDIVRDLQAMEKQITSGISRIQCSFSVWRQFCPNHFILHSFSVIISL